MRLALFQGKPDAALPQKKKKKKKPFLAFRKPTNLSLPSTARKPLEGPGRQPGQPGRKKSQGGKESEKQASEGPRQGTPLARQPKQRDPEDDDDGQAEPVAEPEPSHHKGDPRTHAFHSCNSTKSSDFNHLFRSLRSERKLKHCVTDCNEPDHYRYLRALSEDRSKSAGGTEEEILWERTKEKRCRGGEGRRDGRQGGELGGGAPLGGV